MSNIEDIVNNKSKEKPFDKTAWAEKKQQERNEAYALIDTTAEEVVSDSSKFKQYIDVQSKFDKYSVGNALLITSQMPNATKLKDFDSWKEQGGYVIKNAKGIVILEPGEPYTKADGTISQSYNPKKMFDISQTNIKENTKTNSYDEKLLLEAVFHECPVDIKVVEELDNNKIANWNKEDGVLYVTRDSDTTAIFKAVTKEMALSNFDTTSSEEINNFKAECVSYMISKKYNIDISDIKISDIPSSLKSLDTKEIRNELGSMRSVMEDTNSRMSQYFESITKTQKNKEQVR